MGEDCLDYRSWPTDGRIQSLSHLSRIRVGRGHLLQCAHAVVGPGFGLFDRAPKSHFWLRHRNDLHRIFVVVAIVTPDDLLVRAHNS